MTISNTSPCYCEAVEESGPKCMGEHPMSHDTSIPSSNFDCSICLDMSYDPVVTMCGHLFCWPCLHQWISVHSAALEECPVCRACVKDKIIPLYGRGKVGYANLDANVPPRPSAHRSYVAAASVHPAARFEHHRSITHENHVNSSVPATGFQHHSFTSPRANRGRYTTCSAAAFGLFPALFGFRMIASPAYSGISSGMPAYNGSFRLPTIGHMTSEQRRLNARQEFALYWFLTLLACFASLCFLLF